MPSCFDTSLAHQLRYYHDSTTSTAHTNHHCHHPGTQACSPLNPTLPSCPHGPRPSLELARAQTGDGPRPCEIPQGAIDTASSAIAQQPRAIDLKLGPLATSQRRRPRPHQTSPRPHPDLTSGGQGFDPSAVVPVYYACTTSFTSPPLPRCWRWSLEGTLSTLRPSRRYLACAHAFLLLLLLPPRHKTCARNDPAANLTLSCPTSCQRAPILRVIMGTCMHDLWHWGGRPTLQVPMWTGLTDCLGTAAAWVDSSRLASTTALHCTLCCIGLHRAALGRIPPWPAHGPFPVRTRLTPELLLGYCDTDFDQQGMPPTCAQAILSRLQRRSAWARLPHPPDLAWPGLTWLYLSCLDLPSTMRRSRCLALPSLT